MNFDEYITISDVLLISLIAILIVFAVLCLIALIISLIGKLLAEEEPTATSNASVQTRQSPVSQTTEKVNLSDIINDEKKLVATLVATIAANELDKDIKYKITSIKEI